MSETIKGRDGTATLADGFLTFDFGFSARLAKRSRQSRIPIDRIHQIEYRDDTHLLRVRVRGWSFSKRAREDGCSFRFGSPDGYALAARLVDITGASLAPIDDTPSDGRVAVPAAPTGAYGVRPLPQPYGVSHEGAEALAAAWLEWLGFRGAEATTYSGDGGIDVRQAEWAAQVKNYASSRTVGRPEVQNLFGAASAESRRGAFFTSGSYTSHAVDFADRTGVALFRYDAVAGTIRGANGAARSLVATASAAHSLT
ncbi:restriction endonuclease [Curtobacterium sp. MCBD17_023]|uniref:restriction endonuclease n=1 Tax=Curtobacterium sp. MCBD17_023 TaxID=2175657 RepID=UPI0015E87A82|nr:restriction endonuclease [Curtobacterium sp. MCBD17_023]